jgi:hypothetical protein
MIKRPTAQQAAESSAVKQSVTAAEGTQADALKRKAIEEAKKSPCAEAAEKAAFKGAAAKSEVTVYRVFGGDARAQGYSWTTKDPRTISGFRDVAGLPSGGESGANNTAEFLIKGRTSLSSVIESRPALRLDGNKGGLLEYIINPKDVTVTDFSVLKP